MWYKVKKIYVGDKLIYPMWKVNDNTLLYMPLESDALDRSWKGRTTSPSNISYWTLWWVNTAYNSSWNWYIAVSPTDIVVWSTEWTVSMLVYYTGNISEYRLAMNFNRYGSYWLWIWIYSSKWTIWTNSNSQSFAVPSPLSTNNWYHVLYTVDNNGAIAYINWNQVASWTKTTGSVRWDWSSDSNWNQYIFANRTPDNYWKWWIREVIIESRKWDAAEVEAYNRYIRQKLWIS